MPADPSESALPLPFETARGSASPAPLEVEVTGLFDLYRERLLRYLLSLGLSVEDGEEIVQEVFLALFRHLATVARDDTDDGRVFAETPLPATGKEPDGFIEAGR